MDILELKEFDAYCQDHGNFMQCSAWAEVKSNWKSEYITVRDENGSISGEALILIKQIPILRTALLYAPRGPVCDMHNKDVLGKILERIRSIAIKYNAYMVKMDPLIDESDRVSIHNLRSFGFNYDPAKEGYDTVQCRENYMLDINGKTADEIFKSFKPKWRYNIRLAAKKGIICKFSREEALDDFTAVMEQTAERDEFRARGKQYFNNILKSFGKRAWLCMCYKDNEALSGALVIEHGGVLSYVYGCSSNYHRELMTNYLMQWTMIKYAVENGFDTYDFCGIPYWYDETHKNYGVYRFKRGFNGYIKTYAGEFDYTYRKGIKKCADTVMKHKRLMRQILAVI